MVYALGKVGDASLRVALRPKQSLKMIPSKQILKKYEIASLPRDDDSSLVLCVIASGTSPEAIHKDDTYETNP